MAYFFAISKWKIHFQLNGTLTQAADLTYKPFGPMTAITLEGGLQVFKTYDKNYRIHTIRTGQIMHRTYTLDNVGNIKTITDHLDPARTQRFDYDRLYRLTNAEGSSTHGSGSRRALLLCVWGLLHPLLYAGLSGASTRRRTRNEPRRKSLPTRSLLSLVSVWCVFLPPCRGQVHDPGNHSGLDHKGQAAMTLRTL